MRGAVVGALAIAALVAALMGRGLDAPFDMSSHQGWNGAYYSIVGRNYLRYGPGPLYLAMCMEGGAVVERPHVYLNHPPMIGLLVAASFALFGAGEAQARAVALSLSQVAALLLYVCLVRCLRGRWLAAAAATILSVSAPVWALYGAMPDPQGAGVMVGVFGAMAAVAGWAQTGRRRDLLAAHAFLLFGFLMDWPAFFAPPALAAWLLALRGARARGAALGLLAHALVAGAGLLLWAHVVGQRFPATGLLNALSHHVLLDGAPQVAPLSGHLAQLARHHAAGFFLPVSIGGALGALVLLGRLLRRRGAEQGLLLVPLVVGALHVALFRAGAHAHDYWQCYLAPGLALPLVAVLAGGRGAWRAIVLVLLVASSVVFGFARVAAWSVPSAETGRQVGNAIAAAVAEHEPVASTAPRSVPIEYYSDRKLLWQWRDAAELARRWDPARPPVGAFLVDNDHREGFRVLTDRFGPGVRIGHLTLWDLR
jgi:4-amino-4-deoxy-L-arabinose transferase-like glycosyltransferase